MDKREQIQAAITARQPIRHLTEHNGWEYFKRLIQAEIDNQTPRVSQLTDANHAVMVASRMTYINGLRKAVELAETNSKRIAELEAELAKFKL